MGLGDFGLEERRGAGVCVCGGVCVWRGGCGAWGGAEKAERGLCNLQSSISHQASNEGWWSVTVEDS